MFLFPLASARAQPLRRRHRALQHDACLIVAAVAFAMTCRAVAAAEPQPPEDWRDQVIYFAMIDRFDDGDPRNNDQGAGEYDPRDHRRFSGGDLAGLTRRLDYVAGLGATAVWITPPVANQWWNDKAQYGGYHGYWASDFTGVDAHFGTRASYRAFADALHARGMRLVQDIVVNHTADYFGYDGAYDPAHPERGFVLRSQYDGRNAPGPAPFDRNDARDAVQRADGIYHWTPAIRDFRQRRQELDWQLAELDDLNTEHPEVRQAMRRIHGDWIRDIGVDAFRIDTAFYVPPEFFADFMHADDPGAPGVLKVAADAGIRDFHLFGEGFGVDKPFDNAMARKIDGYMRDAEGRPLLPGMLNFPLYGTLGDVFARGHAPAELRHRIEDTMRTHADPWRMPTFVDNHDVDRFLAGGDEAGLKQALLSILTLPGIPTLYYGTEQGFRAPRAAMFAGGHGSGGRDHFDTGAPLYRWLQRAIALRRGDRVFSRGTPQVLDANPAAPGAIAWRMDHDGRSALVVFNSAARPQLLDALDTSLPPGTPLQPLFAIDGDAPPLQVDRDGRVTLVLPPRAGFVWRAEAAAPVPAHAPRRDTSLPDITIDAPTHGDGDLAISGRAPGLSRLQLVVDGDLASAQAVAVDRDGRWRATLRTDDMLDPAIPHRLVACDPASGRMSAAHRFTIARRWTRVASIDDPLDDDHGPSGRYTYPDDPGWRTPRPADLRGATLWASGGALRVQLRMRALVADWNPANGFDHVAFTLFLRLPGRIDGASLLPQQSARMPDGSRWHLRLRAHGWSNALFAADGADAQHEGRILGESARIEVDPAADTVSFTLPARALGHPDSLDGLAVYATTWDYDGGYRALGGTAGPHRFGGGAADGPKVMDDLWLRVGDAR
jgi:glycosidase